MDEILNVPDGWCCVNHIDIAKINPKFDIKQFKEDIEVSFLPMASVEEISGNYDLSQSRKLSAVKKGYTQFKNGDIIFAKITPCMENGKIAVLDNLLNGIGFGSTEFHVSRPYHNISAQFLFYYFVQSAFRKKAQRTMTGSAGQLRVSTENFKNVSIPLPPILEQQAIVSKIEQIFSDLDNGIENFKKAQEQLKIYRQAVLKKAFEGELTKKWREEQTDLPSSNILIEQIERTNHKKINALKSITENEKKILSELPETWIWGRLGNLVNQIVVGYVGPMTKYVTDDENNGVRLLSTTHIGEKKFLNNKKIRFVIKSFSENNKKSEVKSGDILVARHGDSGKCCIIPEDIKIAQVSNVVIIRPNNKAVLDKFLIHSFGFLKQELQKKKVGGVQQVVNTKTMEAFPFPFCSLKEQKQIVQQIETRLSICDKMEATIAESLQKAESLRQSILKKAFEGKLLNEKELEEVHNAPDWEPAEKLLERIKAEKTNMKAKKKGKK